jgi:integrase
VTPPRRTTAGQRFLGPDEAKQVLEAARGHGFEALFVLAVTAGLRLGELQALRWTDLDLKRQQVRITRTLTKITKGEPTFGAPKTQKSRRTVWLSTTAVNALEKHRLEQHGRRLLAGSAWKDYGLVFTNNLGKPIDNSHVLSRVLHPLLEKAELPRMRFHDLRHTAATILLAQGVPVKVVSEMLGHSDISTTLRIYAHAIVGAQEQAVSVMDQLFRA